MKSKIKFHSIMYRYPLFIFFLALLVISLISDSRGLSISFFNGALIMNSKHLTQIVFAICVVVIVIFSFVNYKLSISKDGIYLKKIDLFVAWDEISAVSHVWINEYSHSWNFFYLYNRKTIVIYRKKYKPICVYNISLLALYAVKFYNHKIKTNIVSATVATVFNVALHAVIIYGIYSKQIYRIRIQHLLIMLGLYAIKVFAIPLIMVKHQNYLYGVSLSHSTACKSNASDAIHLT